MALPADFNKIFGSTATGGLTPIGDVNYAKGWEFVGANPPTKNDFSYLQNLSDLKSQWLYSNKLQRTNPFGDIKSDGAAAISTALENLGLGEAAKRAVGTAANQIPDMGSFTSGTGTNSVWFKFPNGMIVQAGYVITSSSSAVSVTFPTAFLNGPTSTGVAYSLTPTTSGNIIACATGSSLTSISGVRTFTTAGAQQSNGVFWIAVGG